MAVGVLMSQLLAVALISIHAVALGCFGFGVPSSSDVIRPYAPIGRWAGHWGIDVASQVGSTVRAIDGGVVRFSGTVVRNNTVSIDHGGGVITSYSYLEATTVQRGDRVVRGGPVGVSGIHDDREAFHLSLRLKGRYVDPLVLNRCRAGPSAGLYLAVRSSTYAVGRARDSRRHFRPATQRSSRHGESRSESAGA